jgi:hypothetical protein
VAVAHDDAGLTRPSSPSEAAVRGSGREDQVQQFEYQVGGVSMSSNFEALEAYFNEMGAEGWELAYVFTGVAGRYLFKRPKQMPIDPPPPAPAC